MSDNIIQKFRELKRIEPSEEFRRECRHLLLTRIKTNRIPAEKNSWWPVFVFASLAAVIILRAAIGFISEPATVGSSFENLNEEYELLAVNIDEILERRAVNATLAAAIDEISTGVNHLNYAILQSEKDVIKMERVTNPEIDRLLEEITL